ncbi:MAG: sulfotransferase [Pseudomonadota bacterium]
MDLLRTFPGAFIIGTGRCGSTLLSDILRDHPDVLDVSEFLSSLNAQAFYPKRFDGPTFWRRLSRPRPGWRAAIPPEVSEFAYPLGPDAAYTNETLPPVLRVTLARMNADCDALYAALEPVIKARPVEPAAEHYRFVFDFLCHELGKRMWVERSGASALMLPAILAGFPGTKIVHLVRDGRETALSMADHPGFRLLMSYRLLLAKTGIKALEIGNVFGNSPRILVLYQLLERLMNQERGAARSHPVASYGAMWNTTLMRALDRIGETPHQRRLTLSYEGLVARPLPTIRHLADFLEVEAQDTWLRTAAAQPSPRPQRFLARSMADREALQRTCWRALERLGYPPMDGDVGRAEPTRLPA